MAATAAPRKAVAAREARHATGGHRYPQAVVGPKPIRLADRGGLYLLLVPGGACRWRRDCRRPLTSRRSALGPRIYPDTGLADARAGRDEARKLPAVVCPREHRKATKEARREAVASRFEVVAREWLLVKKAGWTPKQYDKERTRLENHAFPWIGRLPITDIGVAEIRPPLLRLVQRARLAQAHRSPKRDAAPSRWNGGSWMKIGPAQP